MKYSVRKNNNIRKPVAAMILAVIFSMMLTCIFAPQKVNAEEKSGYWKYTGAEVVGPDMNYENSTMSGGFGSYACSAICLDDAYLDNHQGSCKGEQVNILIDVEEPPMTDLKPGQEVRMTVNASFSATNPHDAVLFYSCRVHCDMGKNEFHNSEIKFKTADDKTALGIDRTSEPNDYYGFGGHFFVIEGDQTFRAEIPDGRPGEKLWIRQTFTYGRGEDAIDTYYYYEWVDTTPTETPPVVGNDEKETEPEEDDDKKVHIVVDSDADKEPGDQDGGFIPSGIVEGWKVAKDVVGVAGGAAAAVAAIALGLAAKSTKYRMVIYKDFGDTLRRGEEVLVYACILERDDKGNERVNHELTSQIRIFSHDGTFNVNEQGALAGDYKGAKVYVRRDIPSSQKEGIVSFKFTGKGGTFTNRMKFKLEMEPEIIFYQENMALVAKDEKGAAIGFTVKGLDPKKTKIDLKITGSSYAYSYVPAVTEQNEPIPGTYFAVLGDINEAEGEPGTYSVHTLKVTAYDDLDSAVGEIDIYRVTLGLNIGADTLNCYRVLKKEAAGKDVDDLTDSDFDISYTKVPVMVLKVDEQAHEMYYTPVDADIQIEPIDSDDQLMKERLDSLGIEYRLINLENSIAEYAFYCSKGWLEPPLRPKVRLKGRAVIDENGKNEEYICEKEVVLLSQPKRQFITASDIEKDKEIEDWLINMTYLCYEVDGLMNILDSELMRIDVIRDGYDEHFGYDPILILQLKSSLEDAIYQLNMNRLMKRQMRYEKMQETAYADDNFLTNVSKSFAMVSDDYINTWPGIALRIILSVTTSGLSEVPFTVMDVNKAVSAYNERTLLCDRTTMKKLYAGAKPVVVSAVIGGLISGGIWGLGTMVKATIPDAVKISIKNWAVETSKAALKKVPEKLIWGSQNLYKFFKNTAEKINSYDPRKLLYGVRKAAAEANSLNSAAKNIMQKEVIAIRNGPRSFMGKVMDKLQAAGELNAAKKYDRFKKAWDRYKYDKSGKALQEVIDAGQEIMSDPFALNALNADGRTAEQIASKIKLPNDYRAGYNWFKAEFVDNPAGRIIKERVSIVKKVPKENVSVYRATGKTAKEIKEGFSSPCDSDNQILIKDPKTGKTDYLSQAESDVFVAEGYCDAMGRTYKDSADAIRITNDNYIVSITKTHQEYYQGFQKFKTTEAFTTEEIAANIKTGKFKMTEGATEMTQGVKALTQDTAKLERVMKQCDDFLKRNKPNLSLEALDEIKNMHRGFDAGHQVPKTHDLYVPKDIRAQAMGMESGFSLQSEKTVELIRLMENQGPNRLTMGEVYDYLNLKGSSYQKAVSDMADDFLKVNANCGAANQKAGSFFWNTSSTSPLNGAVAGISGVAGSKMKK
ncbi:MAG: hypothetical protein IKG30_12090 [Clostridiales bacterium]|nr:hypothetical protein [Clostridiales bacterium]